MIIRDYINKTLAINYLIQRNKKRMKVYDSQRSVDQFLENNDFGTQQSQPCARGISSQQNFAKQSSQALLQHPTPGLRTALDTL